MNEAFAAEGLLSGGLIWFTLADYSELPVQQKPSVFQHKTAINRNTDERVRGYTKLA
jgi:hypothetical protein